MVEDCVKKTREIEELQKDEQYFKKLLTRHQKMIFACILGSALWAMNSVLEKVSKQEEVREMYKGDNAQ